MNEVLLFGVGIPALVAIVVQLLKALGLPEDWAAIEALIAGIVFSYVATLVDNFPQIIPYVQPLIYGLVIWGSSTGIYHLVKNAATKLGIVGKVGTP